MENWKWYWNRKNSVFHAYSSFFLSLVFVSRNEEKLVSVHFYSSFRRKATSMFRRISVFTSSGSQFSQVERKFGVNTVSLRVQYSITAQPIGWNSYDVTRLVPMEHVRYKKHLLESVTLSYSHFDFQLATDFTEFWISQYCQLVILVHLKTWFILHK